jgi:hypothetical protein
MDRITHQSPRQRGYGSTSSLRNDSLKHTRKHEKGREESNQEAKHSGSGGPSGQEGRTVRTGHADRPACCRGLSAHTPRAVRPYTADRPKSTQNLQRRPRITDRPRGASGLSARHPRTVRLLLRTVRNLAQQKLKATTDRKTRPRKNTKNTGRTRSSWTVCRPLADRPLLADRTENSSTTKVNSPKSSSNFPNSRSYGDKGLGT